MLEIFRKMEEADLSISSENKASRILVIKNQMRIYRRHTVTTLIVTVVQAKINSFSSWWKQIFDEWMPAADMSIKEKTV